MVNNIPELSDENMSELNLSALGLLEQILDRSDADLGFIIVIKNNTIIILI